MTVHGLDGDARSVQVGRRDDALRSRIREALHAGFESKIVTNGAYGGIDPANICNRGLTAAGYSSRSTPASDLG
ncbi:poly-gamma-glutamate hydrolase family protein [Mesorhizobium sp.]|uniref:poly-gamma-glutamate hydrolase family protein n=1 Tax=Mesorhizobium sp. TaxID=1871066 RepID=UPI000FE64C0D|nr:MAG: hypothetical protein EOS59_07575 [Mesorhizobium sp.]RWE58590.1 MAG: hypothetical protein EOS24_17705 [Mesorhizobium sp.]RWF09208.1 MAG: hypothetical protein EOS69_20505 [Mesorhizobium sp.]